MSYALVARLDIAAVAAAPAAGDVDVELVERFRAGERRAFDELVRRYQRSIYYLALRYLKNEADAADVTQRAFVRAFEALDRFRGGASFRTWLYKIAVNLALNHIRDHRRERATEIADDALTTDAVGLGRVLDAEAAARLRAGVEALPPRQRLVLELRIYDELPFKQVAEIAGSTENAAKVNFHHAMCRLRELIGEEAP